jgi:hypothetical protein
MWFDTSFMRTTFNKENAMTTESEDHGSKPVASGFPVPFAVEQLRSDIQEVLLLLARQLHFVFGRSDRGQLTEQSTLLGLAAGGDMNDPDSTPQDLGLRYELVQDTHLAETLEDLYGYAFHGMLDLSRPEFDSGSSATWISTIVRDLEGSAFAEQWAAYVPTPSVVVGDHGLMTAAGRCLLVCETAQARRVLEGDDDNFMDWVGRNQDGLSMRQVALLSGMTEASVRTLSNPKRRNALVTVNDGKNVTVAISAAKTWLLAKGRYVPIRRTNRDGQIDLARKRFGGADELLWALDQRLQFLIGQNEADNDAIRRRLAAIHPDLVDASDPTRPRLRLGGKVLTDATAMSAIGDALAMPGDLLALRAAEAHARDVLNELEQQIQRRVHAAMTP